MDAKSCWILFTGKVFILVIQKDAFIRFISVFLRRAFALVVVLLPNLAPKRDKKQQLCWSLKPTAQWELRLVPLVVLTPTLLAWQPKGWPQHGACLAAEPTVTVVWVVQILGHVPSYIWFHTWTITNIVLVSPSRIFITVWSKFWAQGDKLQILQAMPLGYHKVCKCIKYSSETTQRCQTSPNLKIMIKQ